MSPEIKILHLEDTDADAELIEMTIRRHGIPCTMQRVQTREAFEAALETGGFELIISDFSLPAFDGLSALELAVQRRPEIPFIFCSGTLGEEAAINALRGGACDYVFKHRLPRLGRAVERALEDAEKRRELQRVENAMIQSEHKYRQLFESLSEAALLADAHSGRIIDTNRQAESLLGRSRSQILGTTVDRLLPAETLAEYRRRLVAPAQSPKRAVFEGEILPCDGRAIPVLISAAPIVIHDRHLILGLYRDVTGQKQTEAELRELRQRLSAYEHSPAGAH
jgi:PAS domain S-box-containing protein